MKHDFMICALTLLGLVSYAKAANLPPEVQARHSADTSCDGSLTKDAKAYTLSDGVSLYLVPCYSNQTDAGILVSSRGYFYTANPNGKPLVDEVLVLTFSEKSIQSAYIIDGASFDPSSFTLSANNKFSRSLNCGTSSVSKISLENGIPGIVTTEVRSKNICDNSNTAWPLVFKQ